VRVPAFVNGGVIPSEVRGSVNTDLLSVVDWFSTVVKMGNTEGNYITVPINIYSFFF
jgi:hypothetical protein